MTPASRSRTLLREQGYLVGTVEFWNPHAKIRQDLFGFADLIAVQRDIPPLLVQVTTTAWTARVKKILHEPRALTCLQGGFRIYVHGWRKLKTNRNRWTPRIIEINETDFSDDIKAACENSGLQSGNPSES